MRQVLLLTLPFLWSSVSAHSHVTNIVVDGISYEGYDPRAPNDEVLGAWSTDVHEDGWIGYGSYQLEDIICHIDGSNAKGYVPVKAGDSISIQWMGWPESHHGPVLTYLARCGEDGTASCASINKTELAFFTIGRAGLLDPTRNATEYATARGVWATDELIARNNSWLVTVPPAMAPGSYVLRHEIIALHYVNIPGMGPQHYPQCWNFQVIGNGTERPEGVLGTKLYNLDEQPGLRYDIYQKEPPPYEIPGPPLVEGAVGMPRQTRSAVEEMGTAVPAE